TRPGRPGSGARWMAPLLAVFLASFAGAPGCATDPGDLRPPHVLVAPYDATDGNVLWAVAPLVNESGTTDANSMAVSGAGVALITETRGLPAVPLNRTIGAIRALGRTPVANVADARALAK